MLQQRSLEHKGSFANYPFAEVAAEIRQFGLSGSLRVSCGENKSMIYFEDGAVVHAVSNARRLRLFSLLIEAGKLQKEDLAKYPDFLDDVKLAARLSEKGILSAEEIDRLLARQAEAVFADVLTWLEGQWLFSPLARLRADMRRSLDVSYIVLTGARSVTPNFVSQRFKSPKETFEPVPFGTDIPSLLPHEGFILSRFDGRSLKFEEIRVLAGMPEAAVAHALYVLWVGGMLKRGNWNAAFSPSRLDEIRRTKLSLAKAPEPPDSRKQKVEDTPEPADLVSTEPAVPEVEVPIGVYLDRVESAETLYDVLGVTASEKQAGIKRSYFALAKLFHPDKYHRESPETLRRVQNAFTELAHAYDVLKNQNSRESYDLKVKKELEAKKKASETGQVSVDGSGVGFESFQQGMEFLKDGDTETAAKCFARAVHYTPNNPVFHAYFGKALSADERHKHRAEAEFQAAVRLDPKDAKIRIMLVEFLIDMNMTKRAEGELKRFLEVSPGNQQAQKMLADLQN